MQLIILIKTNQELICIGSFFMLILKEVSNMVYYDNLTFETQELYELYVLKKYLIKHYDEYIKINMNVEAS